MEVTTNSFASRRPAAHGLPQFHLPIPNTPLDIQVPSMTHSEFNRLQRPSFSTAFSSPSSFSHYSSSPSITIRDLTLSPGVAASDGLSPLSSGVTSGSSQSPQAGITPYLPQGTWALPGNSSYTYSSTPHGAQAAAMESNRRAGFSPNGAPYNGSPSGGGYNGSPNGYSGHSQSPTMAPGQAAFSRRNHHHTGMSPNDVGYTGTNSQPPTTTEGLAPPPHDSISSPFPHPVPGSGSGHSGVLSHPANHQPLQHQMMNHQTQGSHHHTPSTTAPPDNYSRPPPTASYYTTPSSSTPHQSSFPSFAPTHASPTQASPTSMGVISRAIPSISASHPPPMQAPSQFGSRPYSYQPMPPTMGGTVLSNIGNPNGQMTLVGMHPMQHGYHPNHPLQHGIYGPPTQQQDRPFKCDICPVSFNRNHDLKRHKRIHLAVKPFPCEFCDKAFSRKDALKRHRLVKGCGNEKTEPNRANVDDTRPDSDGPSGSGRGLNDEPE
ncbi:hypothetical protein F5B20DRAFT_156596 [Whalleya microplaca]|nr:hypothetical protein F5B20DRAFT_156596 [Whalleya microplaca]